MADDYLKRFEGCKFLTQGHYVESHCIERLVDVLTALGAVQVEDLKAQPDILLVAKPTKGLQKELAKCSDPPVILSTKAAVTEWLVPTSDEMVKLLSGGAEVLRAILPLVNYIKMSVADLRWDLRGVKLADVVLEEDLVGFSKHSIHQSDLRRGKLGRVLFQNMTECKLDENASKLISIRKARSLSFRNANCGINLDDVADSHFDKADVDSVVVQQAKDCSFKGIRTSRGMSRSRLQSCVLDNATIGGNLHDVDWMRCQAPRVVVSEVDMRDVTFQKTKLTASSFAGSVMQNVVFKDCDLARSNFSNTLMFNTDLRGCDLRKADFRGAVMLGAKLDRASLAGAQFAGARLVDMATSKLDADFSKTESFTTGKFGAATQDVLSRLQKLKTWEFKFYVLGDDDQCRGAKINFVKRTESCCLEWFTPLPSEFVTSTWKFFEHPGSTLLRDKKVEEALGLVQGLLFGRGAIVPESIGVGFQNAEIGDKMKPLIQTMVYELLEQSPDSLEAMREGKLRAAQAKKDNERELLALLQGGVEGVKQWNRRGKDVKAISRFRQPVNNAGCDLSGIKLHGAVFFDGDWSNCLLVGAQLAKAQLSNNRFDGADMRGVKARGTYLRFCSLQNVDLRDADLTSAHLEGVDLRRAKLDRAVLKNASFNRSTKWPQGFKIPAEMNFAGRGRDPREESPARVNLRRGIGLHKVLKRALSHGFDADLTPGDPTAFEAFLTRSKANCTAARVDEFVKHSLLKKRSPDVDPLVYYHNLADMKRQHKIVDESKALIRSGILLIGSADSMLLTYDLYTGEVFMFDDYVYCKEEFVDGDTLAKQSIFDEDTGREYKLHSDDGQRVFREILRDTACDAWKSMGLYANHVMTSLSE